MKKHHREIIKCIRLMAPDAKVSVLPVSGHAQFNVAVGGKCKRFVTSNTPSRPEICVRNVTKEVASFFNLKPATRI